MEIESFFNNNNVSDSFSDDESWSSPENFDWCSDEEVVLEKNKEPGPIDIEKVAISIKIKDAILFCRVSSMGQVGGFSVSWEVQEEKGKTCARKFKLRVVSTIKVVESAYTGKSCTLKSLITKNRGKNIIIYDVTRFCRNRALGVELLDYALKCNVRLFFVSEGIVWDKEHIGYRAKLVDKLRNAQQESENISRRVRDAKAEKKRRGYHTGGKPKYGYKVVEVEDGKKLIPQMYEQKVVRFIKLCLQVGTPTNVLNSLMEDISPNFDGCPIIFEHAGKKVDKLREPLSYSEIADILNIYEIPKRDVLRDGWTASSVGTIAKREAKELLAKFEKMKM